VNPSIETIELAQCSILDGFPWVTDLMSRATNLRSGFLLRAFEESAEAVLSCLRAPALKEAKSDDLGDDWYTRSCATIV
jgi:hypothetical protein